MRIRQTIFIDSAHQLKDSEDLITKKCTNLHGHTYKIILDFEGYQNESGLMVDFSATKAIVNQLDHRFLNDIFAEDPAWKDQNTTAENLTKYIHSKIKNEFKNIVQLTVSVIEGYKGSDSPVVSFGETWKLVK